jgi:hypothetical protein
MWYENCWKNGIGQRTAQKKQFMGAHPDRNAQLEKVTKLKAQYFGNAEPMISIDTKNKELFGNATPTTVMSSKRR